MLHPLHRPAPVAGGHGYAGETVELSHQLDGTLRVYRADTLLLSVPLPLEQHVIRHFLVATTAYLRGPLAGAFVRSEWD